MRSSGMGDQDEIIELKSSSTVKPRRRHFVAASETNINKNSPETTDANNALLFPRSRSSTTILLTSTPNREEGSAATGKLEKDAGLRHTSAASRNLHICGWWEIGTLVLWQCSLAEFLGTLLFTFVSVASMIAAQRAGFAQPRLAAAVAQGAAYAVAVVATAPLSGGHLNPAITLAALLTAHISAARALLYAAAQVLGAIFGALVVRLAVSATVAAEFVLGGCLVRQVVVVGGGANPGGMAVVGASDGAALAAEIFFTLAFIAAAFSLFVAAFAPAAGAAPPRGCGGRGNFAGRLVIGGVLVGVVLALLVLVSGQLLAPGYTSAGMNPARCFGSAAVSPGGSGAAGLWRQQWVFWLGPILAAILFALFYHGLFYAAPADAAPPPAPLPAEAPSLGSSQPPPPPPPKNRRMDVFLHIKATLENKPGGGGGVDEDGGAAAAEGMVHRKIEIAPYSPASSVEAAAAAYGASPPATAAELGLLEAAQASSTRQVILEHADLSLRNLMDIPSSSSRAVLIAADRRHMDEEVYHI